MGMQDFASALWSRFSRTSKTVSLASWFAGVLADRMLSFLPEAIFWFVLGGGICVAIAFVYGWWLTQSESGQPETELSWGIAAHALTIDQAAQMLGQDSASYIQSIRESLISAICDGRLAPYFDDSIQEQAEQARFELLRSSGTAMRYRVESYRVTRAELDRYVVSMGQQNKLQTQQDRDSQCRTSPGRLRQSSRLSLLLSLASLLSSALGGGDSEMAEMEVTQAIVASSESRDPERLCRATWETFGPYLSEVADTAQRMYSRLASTPTPWPRNVSDDATDAQRLTAQITGRVHEALDLACLGAADGS